MYTSKKSWSRHSSFQHLLILCYHLILQGEMTRSQDYVKSLLRRQVPSRICIFFCFFQNEISYIFSFLQALQFQYSERLRSTSVVQCDMYKYIIKDILNCLMSDCLVCQTLITENVFLPIQCIFHSLRRQLTQKSFRHFWYAYLTNVYFCIIISISLYKIENLL